MKLLKTNDTQYVPVDKIDYIAIDNDNRKKLVIHTVGNMNITNLYPSEAECFIEFNKVLQTLISEQ